MVTKSRIVRIGYSHGIRIPWTLLEQSELREEVEIQATRGRLVIRAARRCRAGWSKAASAMRERGEELLLDPPNATRFDAESWEW